MSLIAEKSGQTLGRALQAWEAGPHSTHRLQIILFYGYIPLSSFLGGKEGRRREESFKTKSSDYNSIPFFLD